VADVAIVGAGPVGRLLALLLGRAGTAVQVLERQARPYDLPRAVHLDHEAARVLQGAGLMGELYPLSEAMDRYEWRTRDGEVLLAVQGGPGPSGWPLSLMFCQADLDHALGCHLAGLANVTERWGWEVESVKDGPGYCRLGGRRGDGVPEEVTARWVVGCDGANSTVRGLVQAGVEDLGYSYGWVVADVVLEDTSPWSPLNIQVCDPARPTTAVSGGPGRRRFEFLCRPEERLEDMAQPEVIWGLLAPWGATPARASLERYAGYTFQSRLAAQWQVGHVLLAGDAAHQMPPFAGQGLCAGLRDVANLAWKLALVLKGLAPEGLMATYASERGPVARAEVELSMALGQLICVLDEAEAAARDAAMVPAARESGPMSVPPAMALGPGALARQSPHAGELGAQGRVTWDGKRGLLDDLLGPGGWVLLCLADAPARLDPAAEAWFAAVGGQVVRFGPGGPEDEDGTYERWFAELGANFVLQRPDFRLFGTATSAAEAGHLLEQAHREVTGGPEGPAQ
jgi:2-polyprenyl-6-methoxyphenol hydroxylase-like FAD-dependent oxidoreductase